ncbi:SAV_6107 family HEPN domain-containing protein [Prescottella subtropica]|uniref:SAV_6107 family HEPN domain-containing protein n=1 Tax=Prescottella subtropica TaxID=2545757 RepID=UPI0014794C62|nr:SAV_6107 family HEPN domain-containing protein [Prescottella subtropica]
MAEVESRVGVGVASSLPVGPAGCAGSTRSPASAPYRATVLLRRADGLLSEAAGASMPDERFRCAYLSALKGAAAVLAACEGAARVASGRRPRSRSAWVLLARAAPEFAAWADYFAEHSALRAAVESGVTRSIDGVAADRFYGEVGRFLIAVDDLLAGAGRHAVDAGTG